METCLFYCKGTYNEICMAQGTNHDAPIQCELVQP